MLISEYTRFLAHISSFRIYVFVYPPFVEKGAQVVQHCPDVFPPGAGQAYVLHPLLENFLQVTYQVFPQVWGNEPLQQAVGPAGRFWW